MIHVKTCTHISGVTEIKKPKAYECEECIKIGSTWVHLRTCQTCGRTLCCDQSPHTHMTHHYKETNHPVVISAEPGEKWLYCYVDDLSVEYT
jgi:uncharacterized UBP type Zn finger protein